jgi:mono/diheme cytochrome c family protein
MGTRTISLISLLLAQPALAQTAAEVRGAYLVNGVAMCGDCHSPRGAQGQPVAGRELSGSPMPGLPAPDTPHHAAYAPAIRGLPPGYDQAALARLLETGIKPDGSRPRPPMPRFRLEPADAEAVAAYLASLK